MLFRVVGHLIGGIDPGRQLTDWNIGLLGNLKALTHCEACAYVLCVCR